MLVSLHIKNYALIESLDVVFDRGFAVITGETGAGKSIVIGALGLLLGERIAGDIVRTGADKAIVEGVLNSDAVARCAHVLARFEIEAMPELLLRREVSAKGASRSFVNDSPVPLAALKEIGDLLVDLHGQHEHQSLLRPETHIGVLDAFAGVAKNLALYRTSYTRLLETTRELRELRARLATIEERAAIIAFQAKDIDALAPQPGEDDEIEQQLRRAEHGEQLFALTEELRMMLYDGDAAAHDQLSQSLQRLTALAAIDPAFEKWRDECTSARAAVDEIASFVRRYNEQLEFDPAQLEISRTRLFALQGLKKKYGGSLEAVIAHRAALTAEQQAATNFDADVARLESAVADERARCADAARRVSDMRSRACAKLEKAIVASLQELGITTPAFTVAMSRHEVPAGDNTLPLDGTHYAATTSGIDTVEFLLSTNAGEPVKQLVKVASGGEVSRIMLALKAALAACDKTPVLVFDEIDVGISGRIAQQVGAMMRALADHHQVIAITHLPQIAGFAQEHYVVEKAQSKGTSSTTMRKLTRDERVRAIAALLSGDHVTEASLKSARELMR